MKRHVALARVSSREQEREGFSLAVQEDALRNFATREGGEIVKLFRIAETASKTDERKTFKELIAYAKANAEKLDALLFYKVDRAARNLFDYVELERLESDYGVPFISVSQPTENSPAGRMMRRTLANMASFYTIPSNSRSMSKKAYSVASMRVGSSGKLRTATKTFASTAEALFRLMMSQQRQSNESFICLRMRT